MGKQVVHVRNDSADGEAVTRAQAAMRKWHEAGFAVAPVPADGKDHPYSNGRFPNACPVCTGQVAFENRHSGTSMTWEPPPADDGLTECVQCGDQLTAVQWEFDPCPPDPDGTHRAACDAPRDPL